MGKEVPKPHSQLRNQWQLKAAERGRVHVHAPYVHMPQCKCGGRGLIVGVSFLYSSCEYPRPKSNHQISKHFYPVILPTQLISLLKDTIHGITNPFSWYWHDTFWQLRQKKGSHQTGPKTLDFSASRTQNYIPDNWLLLLNYPIVQKFFTAAQDKLKRWLNLVFVYLKLILFHF